MEEIKADLEKIKKNLIADCDHEGRGFRSFAIINEPGYHKNEIFMFEDGRKICSKYNRGSCSKVFQHELHVCSYLMKCSCNQLKLCTSNRWKKRN